MNTKRDATTSRWIEIVHSPDDGGWHVQQNRPDGSFRTSTKTYPSSAAARCAHLYGDVQWSEWQ